jgi:hypothetical protein
LPPAVLRLDGRISQPHHTLRAGRRASRTILPDIFGLPFVEQIEGEWVVLRAGACELALHRVGKQYRVGDAGSWKVETNAKLVFSVARDLKEMRGELAFNQVQLRFIRNKKREAPGRASRLSSRGHPDKWPIPERRRLRQDGAVGLDKPEGQFAAKQ